MTGRYWGEVIWVIYTRYQVPVSRLYPVLPGFLAGLTGGYWGGSNMGNIYPLVDSTPFYPDSTRVFLPGQIRV